MLHFGMSATPSHQAVISEADLRALGVQAYENLGLTRQDAQDACRIMVLADLFGISTHGMSRFESYGERLVIKGINARPAIALERVAPALVKVDGDNGVGPLVGMRSLQAAMDVARACGVGIALARGSNHFGPISPYSYIAAEAGFASMIASSATTSIAPWGGSDARLGNNPLGFGVPNPAGRPFLLDMAMSVVARAKIRDALKRGESIPGTWATDKQGRPTEDPKQALDGFLQPMGGHKGYGLALLVDLFSGLFSGAAYLNHIKSWMHEADQPQNLGHFFLLIDTKVLGSQRWLAERMMDFASILHASPPADPGHPVIVPGEIELNKMEHQRKHGISLDAATLQVLRHYASGSPAGRP
jgi:ureidoglycolate dehydrogenase (NAD+)